MCRPKALEPVEAVYDYETVDDDNESEPEDNLSYFSYDDSEMSEEEEEEISEEHWKEMLAQGRERWDALMRDFRSENEYAEFEDALKLSSEQSKLQRPFGNNGDRDQDKDDGHGISA